MYTLYQLKERSMKMTEVDGLREPYFTQLSYND